MRSEHRRFLILTLTALELLVFSGLAAWRISARHASGWTGLFYQAKDETLELLPPVVGTLPIFSTSPGRIVRVAPRSPAAVAGIMPGDVVRSVDGIAVPETDALQALEARSRRGERIHFVIERGGAPREVELKLVSPYTSWTALLEVATVEEKRQVRWPLWGTIVSLGFTTLASLAGTLFYLENPSSMESARAITLLTAVLYVLIPISFAFSILKYRLMEIDVIIRKTLVYAGVTGFLVVGYLVLVYGLGLALVTSFGVESQAVTIFATLAVALLFVPVKNRLQRFVDRRFFRRQLDYDEARRRRSACRTRSSPASTSRRRPGPRGRCSAPRTGGPTSVSPRSWRGSGPSG